MGKIQCHLSSKLVSDQMFDKDRILYSYKIIDKYRDVGMVAVQCIYFDSDYLKYQGFKCCADCTFCAKMHYLCITVQKQCFFFTLCRTCTKMFDYKRSTINVKIGGKNPSECIFLFFMLFNELSQRSITLLPDV